MLNRVSAAEGFMATQASTQQYLQHPNQFTESSATFVPELLRLKKEILNKLGLGIDVSSLISQYLLLLSKTYLASDAEFLSFGPYKIRMGVSGEPEFIFEREDASLKSHNYRYFDDTCKKSYFVLLDASNKISYDCSVMQEFYMVPKNCGEFSECNINDLVKFTRVISNSDGYMSDDIEVVVPNSIQIPMNFDVEVPFFATNHSQKNEKTILRFNHQPNMEEKIALTSSFIPSQDLVKVSLKTYEKDGYFEKTDSSLDCIFGNLQYQNCEISINESIVEKLMYLKNGYDIFLQNRMVPNHSSTVRR